MGTCRLPSPAELDAYARKVADRPLTVKIFSGNVKVPQRKVTRRRINGLEVPSASASAQRYSPYPAPGSRYQGLLALVTAVPQASAPKSSSSHGRRVRDMSLPGTGNVPSSGFTMPSSGAGGVGGRDKASAEARTREAAAAAAASLALPCAGRHPAAVAGGSLQSGAVQTLHNNAFPKMDAKEVAPIRVPRAMAAPPAVASHAASALCDGGLPGAYAGKSSTVSYNPGGHFVKPPEASGGGLKAIHLPPLCHSALPTHVLPFPHLGAGGQAAGGAGMAYDAQKPRAVFYSAYGAVGGGKPFDPALMPPNVTISALPRNTPHPFYANLPSIDAVVKQITAQSLAQASQQGETSVCQIDDMRLKGHDQQKGGRPGAVDCLGGPLGSLMGPELGSGDPSSRGCAPQFGAVSDAQGDESIVERLLSFSTEMGNVPAGVGFHFPSPHWHGGMPPLPAAPSSAQGYQQQTGGSGFPPPPSSVPQSVGMGNGFMSAHGGGNQPGPSRGAAVGSAFHHHNHGHHHHHHNAGHTCGGTMVQQQQQQQQQQQAGLTQLLQLQHVNPHMLPGQMQNPTCHPGVIQQQMPQQVITQLTSTHQNLPPGSVLLQQQPPVSQHQSVITGRVQPAQQAGVAIGPVSSASSSAQPPVIIQVDGAGDTSSEDDYDEEEEDKDKDDDLGEEAEHVEEEPLNSEDDVSDEEGTELFETDNVVVCQYDKIHRSKNKWKFHLKDGIMNLNGRDFVFSRATGDAEW